MSRSDLFLFIILLKFIFDSDNISGEKEIFSNGGQVIYVRGNPDQGYEYAIFWEPPDNPEYRGIREGWNPLPPDKYSHNKYVRELFVSLPEYRRNKTTVNNLRNGIIPHSKSIAQYVDKLISIYSD